MRQLTHTAQKNNVHIGQKNCQMFCMSKGSAVSIIIICQNTQNASTKTIKTDMYSDLTTYEPALQEELQLKVDYLPASVYSIFYPFSAKKVRI